MLRLAAMIEARLLPRGWGDLIRQAILWAGAYYAYQLVRGLSDGRVALAYQNARHVISLERTLHVFAEPAVQAWVTSQHWLIDGATLWYLNAHFILTIGALTFLYLFRTDAFYGVRNSLMIAMAIALLCYVVFPTAPPRLLKEWGFSDSVADFTGVNPGSAVGTVLVNPFAAVPSMHVAFALLLGWPLARGARRRTVKLLWYAYPAVMTLVVVATGNHFFLDAALGALCAAVSAWLAHRVLAPSRSGAWDGLRPNAEAAA